MMKTKVIYSFFVLFALAAVMVGTTTPAAFADLSNLLEYDITGGEILAINLDGDANSLIISMDTKIDGSIIVTIPRFLIDAKVSGEDDAFFVLVQGEEVNFEETTSDTDRILTIPFSKGNDEIEIIGTFAATASPTRVSIPERSGSPGCEKNNECYIPYEVTIEAGSTVIWTNDDTAAHTVTSGDPLEGPNFEFDSSLFVAGNSFSHTFFKEGTFDYFCMLHPWMTGKVMVTSTTNQGGIDIPLPIPSKTNFITLSLSDTKFVGSQILDVWGEVVPIQPSEKRVDVRVYTPEGKQIAHENFEMRSDNKFSLSLETGGALWDANEGELKVVASYKDYPGADKDIVYEIPVVIDTDGDGIEDEIDQCDTQKEDFDGYQDSDGCPESGPKPEPGPNYTIVVGIIGVVIAAIIVVMAAKKRKKQSSTTLSLKDSKTK